MHIPSSKASDIKRSRKESVLFREISSLYAEASQDDARLIDLFITHVELSSDKGTCVVYFFCEEGEKHFLELLDILKLYKRSLRMALASSLQSRYTPDIIFKFDVQHAKHMRVESLIEKIKGESD